MACTSPAPSLSAASYVGFSGSVVDSSGAMFPFNSRSIIEQGPPVPSSLTRIPLHAEAEHQVCVRVRVLESTNHLIPRNQLYYSVRIQSLNESILSTFGDVTPSTGLILPGETESESLPLLPDHAEVILCPVTAADITFTLCCKERGRVTMVGCFFAGTDSFHSLNGTYQTLGPFYFAYECQGSCTPASLVPWRCEMPRN